MQSKNNLPQTATNTQDPPPRTTRRAFLQTAPLALAAASVAPLAVGQALASDPAQPRPAAVAHWERRLSQAIQTLEALRDYIAAAPARPGRYVDGATLYTLEDRVHQETDDLGLDLQTIGKLSFEQVYTDVSGRPAWYWSLRHSILSQENTREFFQLEINALARKNPTAAAELQALLNGGAL